MRKKQIAALICGLLGCICFWAGDWLITEFSGPDGDLHEKRLV